MKRYTIIFFILSMHLFLPQLEALLNRDYYENNGYAKGYTDYTCSDHFLRNYGGISPNLVKLIPHTSKECYKCRRLSMYGGYFEFEFTKYLPHLMQQLEYFNLHRECVCLWPEHTQEAAQISDGAYLLFEDLISETALFNILKNSKEQCALIENKYLGVSLERSLLTKHGLIISLIAQQFRFSDYYHVCRDIENFSLQRYTERETEEIKDKLQDILEFLYQIYLPLYISCYKKHPTPEIGQEIRLMKLLVKDVTGLDCLASTPTLELTEIVNSYELNDPYIGSKNTNIISEKEKHFALSPIKADPLPVVPISKGVSSFSPESEIFLGQGTLFNDLLLHKDAIQALDQAIILNPSNREAYIERALAHFETNQLSLAFKDYESAKKLTITSPPFKSEHIISMAIFTPEHKTEFSKGLVSGTVDGAKISAVEFVPSIFCCCRGILYGLWAFVCSPIEVSQEMVHTSYAIGEFISTHNVQECFQFIVPEFKELAHSWDKINDYSRGEKIGYIIGKYGLDIFAPIGTIKIVTKVRALKRANTMCTLESCISSESKQAKILEESLKRAILREEIIAESLKKGKILTKTTNVQYHVMQPKHAWDKVIKVSGHVEEDFKTVAFLLENESILSKENFLASKKFANDKIIRSDYQKTINGHNVHAVFETYAETNQVFLQDAWVVTK